jgi:hypothetical protein
VESPSRLIPENPTFWDEGRNFGQQRDMVRGVSSHRGERGRGKAVVPGVIDEDPIEPNKGGGGPTIRPGKLSVPEREFNETEGIDGVVEQGSFSNGKIGVVPVERVTG